MKQYMSDIITWLIAMILPAILSGCARRHADGAFAWPRMNSAADSITATLDSIFFHKEDEQAFSHNLDRLRTISASESGNQEL